MSVTGNRHIVVGIDEGELNVCLARMNLIPTEPNRVKLLKLLEGSVNLAIDGDMQDVQTLKDRWN